MKKLILIAGLLVCSNGWTQVTDEIHERCKDVADYVGCVQIFSGSVPKAKAANDYETELKKALRLLPRRLDNTSLRDFSSAIQPFTDALALAEGDETLRYSQLLLDAKRVEIALDAARAVWDWSITASVKYMGNKNCPALNSMLQPFNRALGGMAVSYVSTDKFCSTTARKEGEMLGAISRVALTIADGDAINLPPFKTVSQVKEEIEASVIAFKDRQKISIRNSNKKRKRITKIMKSDLVNDSKYRQELKELCFEFFGSVIKGREQVSFGDDSSCWFYLAKVFFIEDDYASSIKYINKYMAIDLNDPLARGMKALDESYPFFNNRKIELEEILNKINSTDSQTSDLPN